MSRIVMHREPAPKRKSAKGGRQTEETKADRKEWEKAFPRCWLCLSYFNVSTHHILMGSKRYDQPWNWSRVCDKCHDRIHSEPPKEIWFARLMVAKFTFDLEHADLRMLLITWKG